MLCTQTDNLGVTATSAEQTYDLNDRQEIFLLGYDGLGLSNHRRLTQRSPLQNGDTDLGFRIDPRFVDLAWYIQTPTLDRYYTLRERFLTLWRGRDQDPVQVVFAIPGVGNRAVDLVLDGVLDFPPGDRQFTAQQFSGIFKASDWRLYDPAVNNVEFTTGSEGGLPIPFTIPIPIGRGVINETFVVTYANGSRLAAPEFPIITIYGPVINPIIENLTTDEKIDLSANGGLNVAAGDWVQVDLSGKPRRDSKTIRDQDGNSVEEFLSTDSDLVTWHLSYAGELLSNGSYNSDGNNALRVSGSGANPNTRIAIAYFNRYEGV